MKSRFIQPKFEGPRFSEHTLPLEVAGDLAAYETLVVELAKSLYIKDHPNRQRVPKGFASDFHLHIEKVDDGSARPLLSVVTAGLLALDNTGSVYFDRARELITECVAAPEGQLPKDFPRELLSHFNQIGRSLLSDERMELHGADGSVAVLTQEKRKHLVLAADKVYEKEVELSGTIGEADWERSTFRLRFSDGNSAVVPMPESFHPRAREFGGRSRHQVTVKGIATYDSWDKLQKVISVSSLDIQTNYQLAARFESLLSMVDGWMDGKGIAPDKTLLSEIMGRVVGHYPEDLRLPTIVPTPEGNLLLEWDTPGSPSVDLYLDCMTAVFHAFRGEDPEIEHSFELSSLDAWQQFLALLRAEVDPRPV